MLVAWFNFVGCYGPPYRWRDSRAPFIAEGKSSAEVGELLHISVRTVDTHRHNIMTKLEIHSIAGLTKFAIRHGLCVLN